LHKNSAASIADTTGSNARRRPDGNDGPSRLAWAAALVALAVLAWLACELWAPSLLSLEGWRSHHDAFVGAVRQHPTAALLLVFLLHALLAALALPGASLLMLATGSAFGAYVGTLICLTACTAGATATMLATRHLVRPWVARRWGEQLAAVDAKLAVDGAAYLFSVRMLPVVPFALVNFAAGLGTMKTWTFFWVSFVGMAASTFVYVNAGSELGHVDSFADIFSPTTLGALALIAVVPWIGKLAAAALRRRRREAGKPRTLLLFNYDWDQRGFARWADDFPADTAGFDLFTFPSNARLAGFDLTRFVDRLARRARRRGWQAVTSNHEQFGALAAAMLAERMGWPGTPVKAVLACQHKLHARRVLEQVAPEATVPARLLPARYGEPIPEGIAYPVFVKPVKAAFSVLARTVHSHAEFTAMTRFGAWELWVIRHLVEPFERIAAQRLPEAGSAHRLMLETPATGLQYNLDGYVFASELRPLGFVESVMYPGTQSFMRFAYPCGLPDAARAQAIDVARRFLSAVGFTHGLFNMEFLHDPASGRLTVIEFNPRLAAQFSDLYRRVDGVDLHRVGLELAHGRDPAQLPRLPVSAGAAASFVFRSFDPQARPPMPSLAQRKALARRFPEALLFRFAKTPGQIARDFKWLGSYRYGILHLAGADTHELRARCEAASALLGWPAPDAAPPIGATNPAALRELSLETSQ
jgi:uncharacterized membrane protein YdjX (TVP38/TMEM64 family)